MESPKKKSNIVLALLLSMLTALAGGILFGIIYGIGYYIYFLAAGEIILSVGVYLKFVEKPNWKHITISIIWSVLWTFVFDVLAVVVCEAMFVSSELNISFGVAYKTIFELWKTNNEVKAAMNTRVLQIAGMIILGGTAYGILYLVNYKKAKKLPQSQNNTEFTMNTTMQKPQQPKQKKIEETKKPEEVLSAQMDKFEAEDAYKTIFNACKTAIVDYAKNKDQDKFMADIKDIKAKHISQLNMSTKAKVLGLINKALSKADITTLARKINETMLKIIK